MKTRVVINVVIAITMLMIAGGCTRMDGNEFKTIAENALEEKYGVSFTAIESEKIDGDSAYVWLRPDGIPSGVVKAAVNEDGSGLLDNYITVKLCHETSETVAYNLRNYEGDFYVHTDNSLEYTYAEDMDISAAEYVKNNPADYFVISIILNSQNADYDALCEELDKAAGTLDLKSGYLDVYALDSEKYKEIQSDIGRYDNMSSSEVQYALDDAGGLKISMDLSKSYYSADDILRGDKDE